MNLEEALPAQQPARRKTKKEATNWATKSVALESGAHSTLEKAATKLGISKAKFASAAIRYFTENGLDPTKTSIAEGVQTRAKMGELLFELRKQNVDIGNRLVAIIRTWESNSYKFHQTQQTSLLSYLESIEANVLNHQVAVESHVLAPMLERIVRNGVESHLGRMLSEALFLKLKDAKFSLDELRGTTADYDEKRDKRLVTEMRKLLETASVTTPQATVKPLVAVPVVGAPTKPATAPATPTPNATKPVG